MELTPPSDQHLSDATARMIREQVRAVMHEEIQMRGMTSAASPDSRTQNPDASRDKSDDGEDVHSEAAHLLAAPPLGDIEASETPYVPPKLWPTTKFYWALPKPVRFILVITPLIAPFILSLKFIAQWDVLCLSALAVALVLAEFVVFVCTLVCISPFQCPRKITDPSHLTVPHCCHCWLQRAREARKGG